MPTEVEHTDYDHIGDAETVYITHPATEGVGTSSGKAFKEVWAPKGWTQTTREAYEAHLEVLREQVSAFVASPDAALPEGEPEAQTIINGERGAPPEGTAKAHAGGATRKDG